MKTICPHCHQNYDVPDDYLQQEVTCEKCQKDFIVTQAKNCPRCDAENPQQAFQCRQCHAEFSITPQEKSSPGKKYKLPITIAVSVLAVVAGAGILLFRPGKADLSEQSIPVPAAEKQNTLTVADGDITVGVSFSEDEPEVINAPKESQKISNPVAPVHTIDVLSPRDRAMLAAEKERRETLSALVDKQDIIRDLRANNQDHSFDANIRRFSIEIEKLQKAYRQRLFSLAGTKAHFHMEREFNEYLEKQTELAEVARKRFQARNVMVSDSSPAEKRAEAIEEYKQLGSVFTELLQEVNVAGEKYDIGLAQIIKSVILADMHDMKIDGYAKLDSKAGYITSDEQKELKSLRDRNSLTEEEKSKLAELEKKQQGTLSAEEYRQYTDAKIWDALSDEQRTEFEKQEIASMNMQEINEATSRKAPTSQGKKSPAQTGTIYPITDVFGKTHYLDKEQMARYQKHLEMLRGRGGKKAYQDFMKQGGVAKFLEEDNKKYPPKQPAGQGTSTADNSYQVPKSDVPPPPAYRPGKTANTEKARPQSLPAKEEAIIIPGKSDALYLLGLSALEKRQKSEAFQFFQKAEQEGQTQARYFLAVCYLRGIGVPVDENRAIRYYLASEHSKNIPVVLEQAFIYDRQGNYSNSFASYKRAAENGIANAQFHLALCYLNGNGTSENIKTAREWLQKASDVGYDRAKKKLQELDSASQVKQ